MQPSKLSEFMTAVRNSFEQAAREGEAPVLVTSAAIRPFVRSLVERFRSQTTVLSQAEIHPRARLKTVGSVLERAQADLVRGSGGSVAARHLASAREANSEFAGVFATGKWFVENGVSRRHSRA